MIWSK